MHNQQTNSLIPWATLVHQNVGSTADKLLREFNAFYETLRSQEPAMDHYSEPDQSSPPAHIYLTV
jgi:hypothetical protein